jgi:hypothetical protein
MFMGLKWGRTPEWTGRLNGPPNEMKKAAQMDGAAELAAE